MKRHKVFPMKNLSWQVLLFALIGFAIAEPIYELFRQTPEFLIARQNTVSDVWALTALLSFGLPLIMLVPAWLMNRLKPHWAKVYIWIVSALLAAGLFAQIIQPFENLPPVGFVALSLLTAFPLAYLMLFTRWKMLAMVLAVFSLVLPIRFLFFSSVLQQVTGLPESSFVAGEVKESPDIVFVVFDELPLTTLLDNKLEIDGKQFPGFKRLGMISNWYFDATSVADSTMFSLPAMLTGRYPQDRAVIPTIAEQPVNLFTLLRHRYEFNVKELVTRLCPEEQCPLSSTGNLHRFGALLLDLSAVYLHRITPEAWRHALPDVDSNWSGFFADRQAFFPEGWKDHMGKLVELDRPAIFKQFITSVKAGADKPVLNFIHLMMPHEPLSYYPDGENYGLVWMRGRLEERWEHHDWSIVSAKQRHFLQTQLVDSLLDDLLDQLESAGILESSLLVVVSDHGTSFEKGGQKRVLSDSNAGSMLRVPLFIKAPGQMQGARVSAPVMTVDIFPTVMSALGVDPSQMALDGVSLDAESLGLSRKRVANSYASGQLKMKLIEEKDLRIRGLVSENREQLKLDDENLAMWGIGPLGAFRGKDLSSVCAPKSTSLRYHLSTAKPLKGVMEEGLLNAYVAGEVKGEGLPDSSSPFVVSNHGTIVASGMTWKLNESWHFFCPG